MATQPPTADQHRLSITLDKSLPTYLGYAAVVLMVDYALWSSSPIGLYSTVTLIMLNLWIQLATPDILGDHILNSAALIRLAGRVLTNADDVLKDLTVYLELIGKVAIVSATILIKAIQVMSDMMQPNIHPAAIALATMSVILCLITYKWIEGLVKRVVDASGQLDAWRAGGYPVQPQPQAPVPAQPQQPQAPAPPPMMNMFSSFMTALLDSTATPPGPVRRQGRVPDPRVEDVTDDNEDEDDDDEPERETPAQARRRRRGVTQTIQVSEDVPPADDAELDDLLDSIN